MPSRSASITASSASAHAMSITPKPPMTREPIGEARRIDRDQEVAIFGMGVIVPTESVIAERRRRDYGPGEKSRDGEPVERIGLRLRGRSGRDEGIGRGHGAQC